MRRLLHYLPAPRITGSLDGVSRGRVHGWAIDRTAPFRRLTVEIQTFSGDRVAVLADRYRADVHRDTGLGDGYCGFSVPLHRLRGGRPIRIASRDPSFVLGMIDFSRLPTTAAADQSIVFEHGSFIMAVDQPSGGHISGWAASKASPTSRRLLRLHSHGRIVAQQRATLFREGAATWLPDGYHGFLFSVPAAITSDLVLEDIETGLTFSPRP